MNKHSFAKNQRKALYKYDKMRYILNGKRYTRSGSGGEDTGQYLVFYQQIQCGKQDEKAGTSLGEFPAICDFGEGGIQH